jgi:phage-related baseplate assembly protein
MNERRANDQSLRELLARARERLSQAGSVDADSQKHLSALVRDIDRALGRGGARDAASEAGVHAHRLESLAVRFEADHPSLAEVIREVIDALVRVGI